MDRVVVGGLSEQRHPGERACQRRGEGQHGVMAAAQVGAFAGENGPDLLRGERGQGVGGDHDPVPDGGQAVDSVGTVVEDYHVPLGARASSRGDQGGVLAAAVPSSMRLANEPQARPEHYCGGQRQPGDGDHPAAGHGRASQHAASSRPGPGQMRRRGRSGACYGDAARRAIGGDLAAHACFGEPV
jgi:hypothetical protein